MMKEVYATCGIRGNANNPRLAGGRIRLSHLRDDATKVRLTAPRTCRRRFNAVSCVASGRCARRAAAARIRHRPGQRAASFALSTPM
jgi:hypothetical protein